MSRQRSKKPKPRPSPTVFVSSKGKAAIGQLESAILLWFNEADPVSILVLASNAHDCYHAIGKNIGKPSEFQQRMEKMPRSFQERAKYIQDFAKHGFKDLDEIAPFESIFAECLMIVSIQCHRNIFGWVGPLMTLFYARAFTDCSRWMPELHELPQVIIDSGILEDVGIGTRKECFERFKATLETHPMARVSRFNPHR